MKLFGFKAFVPKKVSFAHFLNFEKLGSSFEYISRNFFF
jgi:hypothetical protein